MGVKMVLWIAVLIVALAMFSGCGRGEQPAGQEWQAEVPALERVARQRLGLQ